MIDIIIDLIDKLDSTGFEKIREGFINDLKIQLDSLDKVFMYFWSKIDNQKYEFYKRNESIELARKIELETVKHLIHHLFRKSNRMILKLKTNSEFKQEDYEL